MTPPPFTPDAIGRWRQVRVDTHAVQRRIDRLKTRSVKGALKKDLLRLALSMVDLTTLEGADSPEKVRALCRKAMRPAPERSDVPACAAVCVYPSLVPVAKAALGASGVHIAAVATAFPSGQLPLDLRLAEVRRTVELGADEIDMVISRGAFLSGDLQAVYEEIVATKEACGPAHLKVILETGELGTLDDVATASRLAIDAGADFIKTSTGKVQPAATLPVTLVMLEAIRDHHLATGRVVGMKPAGGIRHAKLALTYLVLVAETLGADWLHPDRFRFGASALVNDLLRQIAWTEEGVYPSPRRFSVD
ncbi:MAG: putative Deoxyribose-phosphate aldolase [Pseudomonadota bacterium]|jgi:deoxyribose-phosphate aldolase